MNVSHLQDIQDPDVALDQPTVEGIILIARDLFGTAAKTAIARCALVARSEGKEEAYGLWLSAFKRLDDDGREACGDGDMDGSAEPAPPPGTSIAD